MKKFASIVSLSLASVALAAGCSVDVQDEAFDVGAGEEAVCNNLDGTNAMLASLAAAMGSELGRWDILKDMEIYRGYNNQEMLRIKSSVRYRCTNSCKYTDWVLSLQDSRYDQSFIFQGGQKLNSWTFASRLVNGYRAQQTCEARSLTDTNTCKGAEDHFLEKTAVADATCDGVDQGLAFFTFKATKGLSGGGEVSPEAPLVAPNKLNRKLVWAYNNITTPNPPAHEQHLINPYLQFSVAADGMSVVIDPGEDTVDVPPPPPATCIDACQVPPTTPSVNLSQPAPGVCCTCNGVAGFMKPAGGRFPAGTFKCMP
jgi:hypothetical protein